MRRSWPIVPRPGQAEVAEELARLVEGAKVVLFSAPTGWGKTHAVLAALVEAKALPAAWLVRSLALGRRIAEDAALWGLTSFVAAGREKACPLAGEKGAAIHDFCKYFRFKCPYAALPRTPPLATSWEELVAKGKGERWCPYFAQDLVQADVVVQNYNRGLRRSVRAVVVDECHNLALPNERVIPLARFVEAVAAARELGASERLQRALQRMAQAAVVVAEGVLDASLFLSDEERAELQELYYRALGEGDTRLKPLADLLRAPAAYVEGERIHLFRPQPLPPLKPMILVTATPVPLPLARIEAELRVPWSVKPRAEIVEEVTTRFDEYDQRMALKYKRILLEAAKRHRRVIAFAASERVARDLRAWCTYEETTPPPDWEGVLLLRARGRFSEGVDLPADCVVLVGAPYLPPSVTDRLARAYKVAGCEDPVRAAIDAPMLATTLQCIGRAWRDPLKPPSVVLADTRYTRYRKELENYLELIDGKGVASN